LNVTGTFAERLARLVMDRINGRRFVTAASATIVGGWFGVLAVLRSTDSSRPVFDYSVLILAVIVGATLGAILPSFVAWLVARD